MSGVGKWTAEEKDINPTTKRNPTFAFGGQKPMIGCSRILLYMFSVGIGLLITVCIIVAVERPNGCTECCEYEGEEWIDCKLEDWERELEWRRRDG